MYKKCETILKELENEGKIKVWWDFKFPEKEPLKLRLKDMLEEQVDEKYYLSDTGIIYFQKQAEKRGENLADYNDGRMLTVAHGQSIGSNKDLSICPTLDTQFSNNWRGVVLEPKCEQVGMLDIKGHDCIKRVYSQEGLSPTISTCQGGNTQPKIITHTIEQTVKVRKYPVDIENLKETLCYCKNKEKLTNRQIAEYLDIPQTQVEHYFRKDESFAIPSPKIWLKLKEILKIEVDYFDKSIMEFEEKAGVFEKSNRIYDEDGLAPTLMQQEEKILIKNNTKKGYLEAYPGDGVYTNITTKRGTVQPQTIQTITTLQDKGVVLDDLKIRKLTAKECWRLMGFDDKDFEKAKEHLNNKFYKGKDKSNSQLYKQAGNSICVPVLEKIFKNLL